MSDDDDKPKRERLNPRAKRPDDGKVVYLKNGRKIRKGAGRPAFVATPDERRLVQSMVANGIPQDQIRLCIVNPASGHPIARETFVSAFARELAVAKAQVDAMVGASLVQRAIGRPPRVLEETTEVKGDKTVTRKVIDPGCEPSDTAIIWYEKSRRGFKEGHVIEHTGPDGEPLPQAVQQTIIVLPAGRSAEDYVKALPKPRED
jgi:hypothetical protein